ncbi:indole-3-glycerol phosphate synthase TrpC [Anaerolineales bacterium HSG24]|nr:indole-3-glycerol phosphate synthase TrpC [Anaerolineales bacterium HSG24]
MTILDDIVQYKKTEELPVQKQAHPLATIQAEVETAPQPRDFVAALRHSNEVALIAEVKKASPSKGVLRPDFDPLSLATTYADNGASAISVLTDMKYFQGQLAYLSQIRQTVNTPILRKDFIFDPYQLYEACLAGADAILLIAAVLNDQLLAELLTLARSLNLTALIEVHDRAELERVLPLKPRLIGVNNRDLRDFSVDLNTCINLRQYVPTEVCFVAESGIRTSADVAWLKTEGVDAILVGEALVVSDNVGDKVRELARRET